MPLTTPVHVLKYLWTEKKLNDGASKKGANPKLLMNGGKT